MQYSTDSKQQRIVLGVGKYLPEGPRLVWNKVVVTQGTIELTEF